MPVKAVQHVARMRGGAQAQLLLASDGNHYIVKFQNNPQHRRVLANEMLAYVLLGHLELPAPHGEIIAVDPDLIAASPALHIETGGRRMPVEPGFHFGSRYPGDPARQPVYDYLPDALLRQVLNTDAFIGMVAFDKWVSNVDGRQAIFFRDRASSWRPAAAAGDPHERGFVAAMIDHGYAFNAQQWSFRELPQLGVYPRPWLYQPGTGYDSFEPWLDRILHVSPAVLDDGQKAIPAQWYEGDFAAMDRLLEQLYQRRRRLPDLLRAAKQGPRDFFPNWP